MTNTENNGGRIGNGNGMGGAGPIGAINYHAVTPLEGASNWQTWKFQMKMVLTLEGLWVCVLGTDAETSRMERALARICLSVKSHCIQYVRDATTPKAAWDNLKNIFEDKSLYRRVILLRQLHRVDFNQHNSMAEYIEAIMGNVQQLADIGKTIEDGEIAELLLSGLPMEYDVLVSNLESASMTSTLSSELVRTRLLQEEFRKQTTSHGGVAEQQTAFISKDLSCHYFKKKGHVKATCFKLRRDKKKKMPQQSLVAMKDKQLSQEWIVDSGCTQHMTNSSLPFFTHGLESTELYATTHSGSYLDSPEIVPWNATALLLAAALTAPIYCYAADKYGRKVGIFIISLTQGISCIPLFLPPNETNTIILHTVAGISTGGLFTILPTYIYEINSITTRGFCLSFMLVMTTLGYLLKLVMDLEVMMYVMTAMVMIQFLSMLCLIESPSFFVKVGEIETAKAKISKLKSLEDNISDLSKELDNLRDESYRAKSHGRITPIHILRNLIWRDATKIGVSLHTTIVLCGSIVFLDQDKVLMQLKIASDPDRMLVLVGAFVGSLVAVLAVLFIEKKYILSFGYFTIVLSMGVLAIYTQIDLTVTSLRWLPIAALAVLVFGYGVVWGFPTIIVVEMFNLEIRATMVGALFTYSQIIKLLHIHTYQYIENYMGIYVLFYVFATVNLYGGIYSMFFIPDLRNKTVKQIEKQLKRIPLIKL